MSNITREEFQLKYNGGDIIPSLKYGQVILPCRCDWEECEGWAMTNEETALIDLQLGFNTQAELDEAIAYRDEIIRKEEERVQSNQGNPEGGESNSGGDR